MEAPFLSAATGEILKKVLSLAAYEMKLTWGFKSELKRLTKRLETAQALLSDAENRQLVRVKTMHVWLKKLKAIACDADDVMDELAFESLQRKLEVQNRTRNKVRDFFFPSNPMAFRLKMAHKVKNINLLLDEIYKEATNELGLRPIEFISTYVEPKEIRMTHPFVDDSKIVGREDDASRVLEMLLDCNDDGNLPVIAVVGMAGLGKTTLAQLVYKDEMIVKSFGERMWVCVSDDFKVERLLNEMLQSLTGSKSEMSNIEGMVKNLREMLGGKRYLFVLDDVWNQDDVKWERMVNALIGLRGDRGSKILVTTHSDQVVSAMQTSLAHHLVGLSDGDSWTMFRRRAFANGGPIETQNLVGVGKRIVKRCKGVPLAIKTLGGLMYSKKDVNEWLLIQDSEIWNSSDNNKDMLPSLVLSFDHLPSPYLKQYFAYCSLFPKDYVMEKNNLIQRWMAQGYLQPPQGSNVLMEDVGNDYFNVLVWNSLLQDVKKDKYNNITSCKMHDLVHDLALHISKNYCLTSKASEVRDVPEVLHLSLISRKEDVISFSKGSAQKLRTLRLFGNLLISGLENLNGLRELHLIYSGIANLPKSIGNLKHLRYLDVSWNPFKSFSGTLAKLYNLQTLRILGCNGLNELLEEFQHLVSLRHFYASDNEVMRNLMPIGIGKLTCLQTLPFYVMGQDDGRQIEELGLLNSLRGELKVYNLELVRNREAAQRSNFSRKPYIQKLIFKWSNIRKEEINNDEDVLEGLQPHENLKGLRIENFEGERLASWMMVACTMPILRCLVKINLKNCNMCKQVPSLGTLPCLEVVEIDGMNNVECIGDEFYGHSDMVLQCFRH